MRKGEYSKEDLKGSFGYGRTVRPEEKKRGSKFKTLRHQLEKKKEIRWLMI